MSQRALSGPGPFRASQIREGDPYELSNGHRIECMSAGGRHGVTQILGGSVLAFDPQARGQVGADVGIVFGEDDENLRAPDLVVGAQRVPGWQRTFPPLAVEYADQGQDEKELKAKITELLAGGTQLVWVVRLTGLLRVEVHARGAAPRTVDADGELVAPGILANPVPVRALVDPDAAAAAALRNLLAPFGYQSLDEFRAAARSDGEKEGKEEGLKEGKREGLREGKREGALAGQVEALLTIFEERGLIPNDAQLVAIRGCTDPALLRRWIARAITAADVAAVLG